MDPLDDDGLLSYASNSNSAKYHLLNRETRVETAWNVFSNGGSGGARLDVLERALDPDLRNALAEVGLSLHEYLAECGFFKFTKGKGAGEGSGTSLASLRVWTKKKAYGSKSGLDQETFHRVFFTEEQRKPSKGAAFDSLEGSSTNISISEDDGSASGTETSLPHNARAHSMSSPREGPDEGGAKGPSSKGREKSAVRGLSGSLKLSQGTPSEGAGLVKATGHNNGGGTAAATNMSNNGSGGSGLLRMGPSPLKAAQSQGAAAGGSADVTGGSDRQLISRHMKYMNIPFEMRVQIARDFYGRLQEARLPHEAVFKRVGNSGLAALQSASMSLEEFLYACPIFKTNGKYCKISPKSLWQTIQERGMSVVLAECESRLERNLEQGLADGGDEDEVGHGEGYLEERGPGRHLASQSALNKRQPPPSQHQQGGKGSGSGGVAPIPVKGGGGGNTMGGVSGEGRSASGGAMKSGGGGLSGRNTLSSAVTAVNNHNNHSNTNNNNNNNSNSINNSNSSTSHNNNNNNNNSHTSSSSGGSHSKAHAGPASSKVSVSGYGGGGPQTSGNSNNPSSGHGGGSATGTGIRLSGKASSSLTQPNSGSPTHPQSHHTTNVNNNNNNNNSGNVVGNSSNNGGGGGTSTAAGTGGHGRKGSVTSASTAATTSKTSKSVPQGQHPSHQEQSQYQGKGGLPPAGTSAASSPSTAPNTHPTKGAGRRVTRSEAPVDAVVTRRLIRAGIPVALSGLLDDLSRDTEEAMEAAGNGARNFFLSRPEHYVVLESVTVVGLKNRSTPMPPDPLAFHTTNTVMSQGLFRSRNGHASVQPPPPPPRATLNDVFEYLLVRGQTAMEDLCVVFGPEIELLLTQTPDFFEVTKGEPSSSSRSPSSPSSSSGLVVKARNLLMALAREQQEVSTLQATLGRLSGGTERATANY